MACFLFSFEVKKGGTYKFTHYHHPKQKIQDKNPQDLTRPGSPPPCPSWVSGFPFLQAAPQVSLTKATPQGAPETGEAVLHPRKEGGPGSQVLPIWRVLNC